MPTILKEALSGPHSPEPMLAALHASPAAPQVLAVLRKSAPDLAAIPLTTHTLYRQFEHTGFRRGYEKNYFLKRTMLTRAVARVHPGG